MGNGPGWSSSDDQISLPPYDGNHQQQFYPPYTHSPGIIGVQPHCLKSHYLIFFVIAENRQHSDSSGGSSASGTSRQTLRENERRSSDRRPSLDERASMRQYPRMKHSSSISSASEFTSVSQQQYHHPPYAASDRMSVQSLRVGNIQQMPRDMSASRASFQNALDNPCEYFIDVM